MNAHRLHGVLPWLFLCLALQSSAMQVRKVEFPGPRQPRHLNAEDEESSRGTGMLEFHRLGFKLKSRGHMSNSSTTTSFLPTHIMNKDEREQNAKGGEPTEYPPVSLPMRVKGVRLIVKNGTKYGTRNSASVRRGVVKKLKPGDSKPGLQIVEILQPRQPIAGLKLKPKLPRSSLEVYNARATTSTTTTSTTTTTSQPQKARVKVYIRHTNSESSTTTSTPTSAPPELKKLKKKRRKNYLQHFATTLPETEESEHETLELMCVTPSVGSKQRLSSTLVRKSWNCSGTRPEMPTRRTNMLSVMIPKAETTQSPIKQEQWTNFQPQTTQESKVEKLIPVFYIPEFQQPSPLPVIYSPIPVLPLIEPKPILNNLQPWIPIPTTEATTPSPSSDWGEGRIIPGQNVWSSLEGASWESGSQSHFVPDGPPKGRRLRKRPPSLARRVKWHLKRLGNFIKGRRRRNHNYK